MDRRESCPFQPVRIMNLVEIHLQSLGDLRPLHPCQFLRRRKGMQERVPTQLAEAEEGAEMVIGYDSGVREAGEHVAALGNETLA